MKLTKQTLYGFNYASGRESVHAAVEKAIAEITVCGQEVELRPHPPTRIKLSVHLEDPKLIGTEQNVRQSRTMGADHDFGIVKQLCLLDERRSRAPQR